MESNDGEGIETVVSLMQYANALSPIVASPKGRLTVGNFSQVSNADLPTFTSLPLSVKVKVSQLMHL